MCDIPIDVADKVQRYGHQWSLITIVRATRDFRILRRSDRALFVRSMNLRGLIWLFARNDESRYNAVIEMTL